MRGDAPPRPRWQAVKLPCGKLVSWGTYVRAFRTAKTMEPNAPVKGWDWCTVPASEVVRAIRRAIDDRVNQRGGLVVREMTDNRKLRLMRDRIKHDCRNCGQPLGGYRFEGSRFCDAGCRGAFYG